MTERLDAEFYKPIFLSIDEKLKSNGEYYLLSDLISNLQLGYTGPTEKYYSEEGVFYLSSKNVINGFVEITDATDKISFDVHKNDLAKTSVITGDVLITRTGNVGKSAVVSFELGEANTAAHVISLRVNEKSDGYFLSSFLNTYHGMLQSERHQRGTIIQGLSVYDIPQFIVPKFNTATQKYIGDKVREAERLRAWGKVLSCKMDDIIQKYQHLHKTSTALFNYIDSDLLTDMLTATTYKKHYVENQKNLRTLGNCYRLYDLFESVVNGYDEREYFGDGLPYIKVADVRPGFIDLKNSPRIRTSSYQEASPDQKPKLGDLLLTRKGSFGIAAVVMEEFDFLSSSEVFVCKPKIKESMPALAWFLNSDAGNMQFWQFSTGTVMPGINQENLRNIVIPYFSDINMEVFNQYHTSFYLSKKVSEQLTVAAKLLVEGLIEGLVTEAELIAAQQGLEAGDAEADAAILRRLKMDGLDGKGQPLFGDVERVYELLELTKT